MGFFNEQLESYKEKIGKEKAESTYRGLVSDYKNLLLFMKSTKNIEDIVIEELDKSLSKIITTGCWEYALWQILQLWSCQYTKMADV